VNKRPSPPNPSILFKRAIRGWSADQLRHAIEDEEARGSASEWEISALKAELRRRVERARRFNAAEH
jgi:hypothetical protein